VSEEWRRRWRGFHGFSVEPPCPPGAEDAELIFCGWRLWGLAAGPRLTGPIVGGVWPPGEPCRSKGFGPLFSTGSGVFSATTRSTALTYIALEPGLSSRALVLGRVALWGNIRNGGQMCDGTQADFGYPVTLDELVRPRTTPVPSLGELCAVYGLGRKRRRR
jgi:hypothetical protein